MSRSTLLLALALLLPRAAWAQAASAPAGDTLRAIDLAQAEVLPELKNRSDVARSLWELYPPALRDARVQGTATVRFVVGEQGAIVAPRVVESSGHAELDGAALRVVQGMRFDPARRGGAPVAAWVNLPLTFTLPAAETSPAASGAGAATPAAEGGAARDVLAGVPAERVKAWADSAGALAPSEVQEPPSVANGVEAARALGEYPRELRDSGAEGTPVVWFVITREGRMSAARVAVSGGSAAVDSAALHAVERIRFHPARVGGVPVDSWVALPFEFKRPPGSQAPRGRAAGDTVQAFELTEVEQLPELRNRSEVAREISRQYPPALRDGGVNGQVLIRMRLGLDGTPEVVQVDRSDHPEFALAALRVVEKMRFTPARVNGKPARVWVSLPISFQLQVQVGPEPMQPTPLGGRGRRDPWGQPWP